MMHGSRGASGMRLDIQQEVLRDLAKSQLNGIIQFFETISGVSKRRGWTISEKLA